jgi:SsrA-binding protein
MSIAQNKKAFHDYFIEERFEAGLALEGWEVKAIRAGRVQLKEAYVMVKGAEVFLIGAHVSALPSASTHIHADPTRSRKLLLHAEEIRKLIGKVERAGYTGTPWFRSTCTTPAAGSNSKSVSPRAKNSMTSVTPRRTRTGSVNSRGSCASRPDARGLPHCPLDGQL